MNKFKDDEKREFERQVVKKYYDAVFEGCVCVFKMVVSKNFRKDRKFYDSIRKIKEKGVKFFENVLDLEIPDYINEFCISQLVMYYEECLNSDVEVRINEKEYYEFYICRPYFSLTETENDDEFDMLLRNLHMVCNGSPGMIDKESLYKCEIDYSPCWDEDRREKPRLFFLKQ